MHVKHNITQRIPLIFLLKCVFIFFPQSSAFISDTPSTVAHGLEIRYYFLYLPFFSF